MDVRQEFVSLARVAGANVSRLCRRFGISRKTGYKWLARAAAGSGLHDRSRRPRGSPRRTAAPAETMVLGLREAQPGWGGRKLRRRLQDQGHGAVPAASTITAILRRHERLRPGKEAAVAPLTRFEHERPNELWQIDFKGHFGIARGRCHPLTVLDDHSRYAICLTACADEATATVRACLAATFRRYGLPERMNMDNGSPWGDGPGSRYTPLTVWLLRLGIRIGHSRPYHPQTNGKDERFHRTLKRDVIQRRGYADLPACQSAFDGFRQTYNCERPHEALGLAVPASRYQPSWRAYPEVLAPIEYDPLDQVRIVQQGGRVSFHGRTLALPKAFLGERVALRPTATEGLWDAMFAAHRIAQVNLRDPVHTFNECVTHVPEQV